MRTGLVLGGGGVMGGAWLVGALDALAQETGWDPATAEVIIGTSAGSMIGSLVASGVPASYMVARSAGQVDELTPDDPDEAAAERTAGAVFRIGRVPAPLPGSIPLAARAIVTPRRLRPLAGLSAFAPEGPVSSEPLKALIRRVVPEGWSSHAGLWIVAGDYTTGRRVVFGREGSPPADLADAVAASCAIPGFYQPVTIGGRRYVDGGIWSASNLDLTAGLGLDLVVCCNPTSSREIPPGGSPLGRLSAAAKRASGRRLGWEARRVRASGTPVVLLQPGAADLAAMGPNLMRRRGRNRVIATAAASVAEQIRRPEVRAELHGLPSVPAS